MNEGATRLVDRFGRVADDLRVSVTDRCNFRCVYCMPLEGLPWLPKSHLLSFEEIVRIAGVFVSAGVKTIRLTGGEPTLRRDLPELVTMLAAIDPGLDIAMTTNGYLLSGLAGPLAAAGLKRVNISVDSLLAHRFEQITRRNALNSVMEGIMAAEEAGLSPVKINCVVVRGQNEDEILDFARLARQTGWEIRFIEFMPLDAQRSWDQSKVVPQAEILSSIEKAFKLNRQGAPGPPGGQAGSGKPTRSISNQTTDGHSHNEGKQPATVWEFADGSPGTIGIIPSVSAPFCASCNRLRITADGQLRTCLFSLEETDLKSLVRNGSSDGHLEDAIRASVWGKQAGHRINEEDFVRPERSMSMIGG